MEHFALNTAPHVGTSNRTELGNGERSLPGRTSWSGIASDLVDPSMAIAFYREVQRSEEAFRTIAETAVDAIISADIDGSICYFNPAAERIFGRPAREALGKPLTILMPRRFAELHRDGLERYVRVGEARVIGGMFAVAGLRADGSEFPVEIALSQSGTTDRRFTAIIRDLTERDEAERTRKDAAVSNERQRMLDSMLIAVEADRKQFANDLHDGPLQHLTASMLQLHTLGEAIATGDPRVPERLEQAQASLGREIEVLRAMMQLLMPPSLEEHGLEASLGDLVSRFRHSSGIRVEADIRSLPPLASAAETALYRIAQEALANAVRHGSATEITVSVSAGHDRVSLSVTDNGDGFDAPAVLAQATVEHFGLAVMQERVEMVGGTLKVDSSPGHGCSLTASLPLHLGTAQASNT